MIYIAYLVYPAAIILANLSVAAWGPAVSPINAFVLIGLDLALRDWLHLRTTARQMGVLIAVSAATTYLLNPAAGTIALASAAAFTAASAADWLVFSRASGTWMQRSLKSNIAGAAVDSVVFPALAFGALMPAVVLAQFAAKVAGGWVWAAAIRKVRA